MRAAFVLTVVVLASMVLMRLKTPSQRYPRTAAFQRLRRHLDLQSPKTAPVSVAEFRGNPP